MYEYICTNCSQPFVYILYVCVYIIYNRYLEEKASFVFLEKFFLRTPHLDVCSIVGDCFMSEEVFLLVGRSRPTKRDAAAASTGRPVVEQLQVSKKISKSTISIHN